MRSLVQSASTFSSSSDRSTVPRFRSALACASAAPLLGSPCAIRAVLVDVAVGPDQRVRHPLPVDLQRRDDLRDHAPRDRRGAPTRTRRARRVSMARSTPTRSGRKSVEPPIGRRAVLRAGLPEARQVLRDGEVAGHPDLLAAADAHAVDAADHRLVAAEDGAHHVVEEPHVLPVLLRVAGVVLGVLLRVAAGAEGPSPAPVKTTATTSRALRRGAEARGSSLHHVGRVGVELARVVERDPGVVEARHLAAVGVAGGPLLVADPLPGCAARGRGPSAHVAGSYVVGANDMRALHDRHSFRGQGPETAGRSPPYRSRRCAPKRGR